MIPGPLDQFGRLYVEAAIASGDISGGVAHTARGSVATVASVPSFFVNGLPFNTTNRLCISANGTITRWLNGLPYTSTGRLVTSPDGVPNALDPFVGGLRVGPAGVYTSSSVPPVVPVIPPTVPISSQPFYGLYRYAQFDINSLLIAGPYVSPQALTDAQIYGAITESATLFGAT